MISRFDLGSKSRFGLLRGIDQEFRFSWSNVVEHMLVLASCLDGMHLKTSVDLGFDICSLSLFAADGLVLLKLFKRAFCVRFTGCLSSGVAL